MKRFLLIALVFSASAHAGVCNITSISKAKHALTFSYSKSSVTVDGLKTCIDTARKKLGSTYTGTISLIPSPGSNELPSNIETEHTVIQVKYSFYDAQAGIHYKGSIH